MIQEIWKVYLLLGSTLKRLYSHPFSDTVHPCHKLLGMTDNINSIW